jgi:hypothetical protein
MADHEHTVARLRLRIGALLALRQTVIGLIAWCLLWGVAVLVLRVAAGLERTWLLLGFAGIAPAVVAAVFTAVRRAPSAAALRALLDRHGKCGGLLMASAEAELGAWKTRVPQVDLPRTSWRAGRFAAMLVAAAAFVAIGFLIPQGYISRPAEQLRIGQEIDRLTDQVQTLAEEEIIDREKAETLTEKLEQVRAEASGDDPVKTWEALDHLQDAAAQAAREAAEEALRRAEQMARAEELAEALKAAADEMAPQQLSEAMGKLAEMVDSAAEESENLQRSLSKEALDRCKNRSLTGEQLDELAEALRKCKGCEADGLRRLCQRGLIDVEALAACKRLGECDAKELAAVLARCGGEGGEPSLTELIDDWREGMAARGGIDRGRGDAPMIWSDASSEEGARFKEQVLPPSAVASLEKSRLAAVSAGAPDGAGAGDGTAATGALRGAAAGTGSAHTHTILPKHKAAVRRYFERKGQEDKP